VGLLQYRDRRHEDSGWCAHRAGHDGDPAVGRVLRQLDDRAAERLELTCSRHLAGHELDPARSPAGSRVTCRHPPSSVARSATVNRYNRYDDGGSLKSSVRRSSREPVSRRMACSDEIAGYSPAVSRSVRVMGWLRASRAPPGGQPAPEGRQRPGHHKDEVFTLPEIFREAGAGSADRGEPMSLLSWGYEPLLPSTDARGSCWVGFSWSWRRCGIGQP
jgi:hypothetical protein